jgi:glycosyltransferase 2 family protein
MSKERGVSGVAATGAAVVGTIVNIAAGIVVAVLTGWRTLDVLSRGHAAVGVALLVALVLGLALLPFVLPLMVGVAERVTGRRFDVGRLPPRAIAIAVAGNVVGWLMYGVAFMALVKGVLGDARGSTLSYVAVYASTYVLGYLAFFIPGGLGVRDLALASAMPALGLATPAQAALVAVASRLWLTILEVVPGLLFWVRLRSSRSPHSHDLADGST